MVQFCVRWVRQLPQPSWTFGWQLESWLLCDNDTWRWWPRLPVVSTFVYRATTILYLMFIGPCIIVIVEEWRTNLMSLAILFHFLCAQHVSDINISIISSLQLCCWITTSVILFSVCCVLEIWCGWFWVVLVLQAEHSRRLLKMDILMSETCWAHNKWNKITSDIKLVFHSSKYV